MFQDITTRKDTHNLIWKPQLRVKQYWTTSAVRTGLSVWALAPRHRSGHQTRKYTHNQIWRPHSVPTSLVVQDQFYSFVQDRGYHFTHTSMDVEAFR